MRWKSLAFAIAAAITLSDGSVPITDSARAACDGEDKIDKSTATDAREKIEAAGYQKVRDLRKGCDNYWHATAEKENKSLYVVLTPKGEVMEEGN